MLRVLVRSKRDADAVKSSIDRFPETSSYTVESLGGARGGGLLEAIERSLEPFTVVLLGREDEDIAPLAMEAARRVPFTAVVVARTRRVRNSTIEMINALLTRARVEIRLTSYWNKSTYILSNSPVGEPIPLRLEPSADTFFVFGEGVRYLARVTGGNLPEGVYLAEKLPLDYHIVFAGNSIVAEFNAAGRGLEANGAVLGEPGPRLPPSLEEIAWENRGLLETLEAHSLRLLEESLEGLRGRVVVPLSGGKDSAAALALAVKALGSERVTAVYVDTGIDFEESRETALENAAALGVEIIEVDAGVDRGLLLERMPLPSPDNRWCTGRKLAALRRALGGISEKHGGAILVVGDRDAESDKRSRRPLVRVGQGLPYPTIAPIRLWSGAHVEAYLALRGLRLNPLYGLGFYRTGCYICFSLRGWEIGIMRESGILDRIVSRRPHHETLIKAFLASRTTGGTPHGGREALADH